MIDLMVDENPKQGQRYNKHAHNDGQIIDKDIHQRLIIQKKKHALPHPQNKLNSTQTIFVLIRRRKSETRVNSPSVGSLTPTFGD